MTPGYTTRFAILLTDVTNLTSSHTQAGTNFLTREFTSKEANISDLKVCWSSV